MRERTVQHPYTCEGLTTGRVTQPSRSVHAGVWFRLLRCLVDEFSLALSTRSAHGWATLERIWPRTARQLLAFFSCRTLDRFEEERAFLFGADISAEFLPTCPDPTARDYDTQKPAAMLDTAGQRQITPPAAHPPMLCTPAGIRRSVFFRDGLSHRT
ncbi:hypothetical protein CDO52_07130 [Nocardiopsis gilva YIM 90087]|uniref:Uncharacterized protein n=1 Tax=Nocardiopsis gilva YIM 90087 TaxID=1235441 RepID=A0A223S397_9ACTN|nr:hypothetical protein [Nocardiopsis gilva]ASU82588.1 hypothetical protein CDO52_07130 [Nocardiopsis gilva YIM 90087]